MNADPKVMEFFPALLGEGESNLLARRIQRRFDALGFGLWAVELPGVATFIGFIDLDVPRFEAQFTPSVEIAWRLALAYWGRRYACKGARKVLAHATQALAICEIVAFTAADNRRSRAVMERIDMHRDPREDYEYPG
jgi:RimJ/RimL family protein N-acetyltransferase